MLEKDGSDDLCVFINIDYSGYHDEYVPCAGTVWRMVFKSFIHMEAADYRGRGVALVSQHAGDCRE